MKRHFTRIFFPVFLLFIASPNSFAEGEGNEYNVKAMFVLNFMKYVEWPEQDISQDFVIGVAGDSEIVEALQKLTVNRKENRKIIIEKVNPLVEGNYRILIITRHEKNRIEEWSKKYQGKQILIISDECRNTNFSAINLINIQNKIRFEINNSQARLGGIKISSRLAELAVSVQP